MSENLTDFSNVTLKRYRITKCSNHIFEKQNTFTSAEREREREIRSGGGGAEVGKRDVRR